ncbi:hypothetical protein [Murimonas intestini]|nr:hypothetical protein [Murimonas intestini]MCR1840698.1 hypothetical protein [Murimonas intestini]MCR1865249.1 hypothetical protein [Murimonas intestini]MCR1883040.1 hypothetical protein [Murimonas intestini]
MDQSENAEIIHGCIALYEVVLLEFLQQRGIIAERCNRYNGIKIIKNI